MLPTLDELSKPLPREELEVLARQFANEGEFVSVQTRFNYAWGLIKAADQPSQRRGVAILTQLFKDAQDRRRETLYYLSIGCYKLGDYTAARRYADVLLDHEPTDPQINKLRQEIEDKLNKEGLFGLAIVSGAVAAQALSAGPPPVREDQRNQAVTAVQEVWARLPANGKPRVRPNGLQEWTVVAGVLLDGQCVAVASGVKAVRAAPGVVSDMHAEVLALRAFSRYLVDNKLCNVASRCVELVVSHTPCGDASISAIEWDHETVEMVGRVVRGRSGPHLKGAVRTKPGRADSPLVLSKSCSDKLALRQVNGCTTSEARAACGPAFVSVLHCPVTADFERCFGRWAEKHVVPLQWRDTTHVKWPSAEGDVPCMTSVVWTAAGGHPSRHEVLCNGIRQGAKKTSPSARSAFCSDRGGSLAKWYPGEWKST